MSARSLGHRAPLLWLVLPLIAGLTAGKVAPGVPTAPLLVGALALAAGAMWAAWSGHRAWAPLFVAAMVLAGYAAYTVTRARLAAWEPLPPREARLALRLDRVFSTGDPRRVSGLATVTRAPEHLRDLAGQRLYFSLQLRAGERAPVRSAVIVATGVLATLPRDPPANTFEGYLAGAGINFRLRRGRVEAVAQPAAAYYRFCAEAAARCRAILGLGIAERRPELAGLLRALMLGETHELSDEQHTLFMQSGTMHLFAISGLNIGVIAGTLQALLLLGRLPAKVRWASGLVLLWLFVDITGASPSAVRAFAMAAFFQTAFILRRPANPLAALAASALAVLLVAPLQLFSASFLMSYAIVAALLLLGLPLGEAWLARWTPWRDLPPVTWTWWQRALAAAWNHLATALAVGIATTLVSLVTGVEYFRLLTPGALAANLGLIPAAMVATLGGFAALLCGAVGFVPGAVLCNHAAAVTLWAIETLVRASVRLPGAFLPAHFTAPWIGPTTLALLLGVLVAGYARGWRDRGGKGRWWPPFAVVGAALIFGVTFGPPP